MHHAPPNEGPDRGRYPTFHRLLRLVSDYMYFSSTWRLDLGLTANQQLVLFELLDEPLTSAQLCRRIGIRSASMTNLVASLSAKGLVERVPHPHDKRKVLVYASKLATTEVMRASTEVAASIEALAVQARSIPDFIEAAAITFQQRARATG